MTPREMVDALADGTDEEVLTVDGFDDAIVGLVEGWDSTGDRFIVVLYDRDACIELLMDRDGMTWDDAEEFFEFNISGAYHGPGTPCFATFPDDEEGEE